MVVLPAGWLSLLARLWHQDRDKFPLLGDKAFLSASARKIKNNLNIPIPQNREQGLEGVDDLVRYSIRCEHLGCNGSITVKSEEARESCLNTRSAFATHFQGTTVVPQPKVLVIKE